MGRDGAKPERHQGREVRAVVPVALCHAAPGLASMQGGVGRQGQAAPRELGESVWKHCSPGLAPAMPGHGSAAGWLEHSLHPGDVLGESSEDVCWEKREHFCSSFLVLPTDKSQFPTETPCPQPRGRGRHLFLQRFSVMYSRDVPVRKP